MTWKRYIRNLPGPKSYCSCETLCSAITVDHVVPKSFLKKAGLGSRQANDYHNLHACCQRLNQEKGASIFGHDFILGDPEMNATLARICLYMWQEYDLPIERNLRTFWLDQSRASPPSILELERHRLISERTRRENTWVTQHCNLDAEQ